MTKPSDFSGVPWKLFLITTLESLLSFYAATFSMAVYFSYKQANDWLFTLIICSCYAFVIFAIVKRIITKLPLAALMLIIPIAPFLALASVVSLIPVLQFLHRYT